MSPLRYQKWLRLNEVRRPMLNEHYDVTTAAYAVGYESYPISVGNIRGCFGFVAAVANSRLLIQRPISLP
ncbi:helix-turn-helix transcriptional regulator [Escherichia coli]|uniref:helix-turn-helix transcriptional regulator n=1 Tax=Escherichia coli TaxID=562 RepID=UPI00148544FA|nr:helix-turn-helix transcriptional regulator [Escherichia coli]